MATPLIDNPSQTIQEGDAVTFRCSLPSLRNAQIHWRRQDGSSFGYDITDEDGILTIPRVEAVDAGAYICTVEDPETGESVESAPAYLTVNPSTRMCYHNSYFFLLTQIKFLDNRNSNG